MPPAPPQHPQSLALVSFAFIWRAMGLLLGSDPLALRVRSLSPFKINFQVSSTRVGKASDSGNHTQRNTRDKIISLISCNKLVTRKCILSQWYRKFIN